MIVKFFDACPDCGQWDPWRQYSTRIIAGQRRNYVKCRRCGKKEVIVWLKKKRLLPESSNKATH